MSRIEKEQFNLMLRSALPERLKRLATPEREGSHISIATLGGSVKQGGYKKYPYISIVPLVSRHILHISKNIFVPELDVTI